MSAPRTYTKRHRSGSTTTWVRLDPGETALIIKPGSHYKLGGQVDDVVASHVLQEASEVSWCSVGQEWTSIGDPTITTPKTEKP